MNRDEWHEEMSRMDEAIDREAAFDEKVDAARAFAQELSCDAINSTPQDIDWRTEAMGEDMEGWTSYEAEECPDCGRDVVVSMLGEHQHRDIEPQIEVHDTPAEGSDFHCISCGHEFEVEYKTGEDYSFEVWECPECHTEHWEDLEERNGCTGYINSEGPMMNYWYPVKISDCEQAARLISHLPLCVVEFADGRTGLALTGGGMDLSPQICQAFIALGYLPPVHFSNLPHFAGWEKYESWVELVVCCQRSAEVERSRNDNRLSHLDDMLSKMRKAVGPEHEHAVVGTKSGRFQCSQPNQSNKPKASMYCTCDNPQPKHVVFDTFEYDKCEACGKEIQ